VPLSFRSFSRSHSTISSEGSTVFKRPTPPPHLSTSPMALRNALIFVVWLLAVALPSGLADSMGVVANRAPASVGTGTHTGMIPSYVHPTSLGDHLISATAPKLETPAAVSPAAMTIVKRSFPTKRDQFIKETKKWSMKAAEKLLKEALKELIGSDNVLVVCTSDEVQALVSSGLKWPDVQACSTYSDYDVNSGVQPTLTQQLRLCQFSECQNLLEPIVNAAIQRCGFLNGRVAVIVGVLVSVFDSCPRPPVVQVKASSVNMSLPD
jgi:hypothetical protein